MLPGCEAVTVEIEPGETGASVAFDVTATDDCSEPVSVECDSPSGSFFPEGETEVSCIAEDGCGGTSECTFPVTLESDSDSDSGSDSDSDSGSDSDSDSGGAR